MSTHKRFLVSYFVDLIASRRGSLPVNTTIRWEYPLNFFNTSFGQNAVSIPSSMTRVSGANEINERNYFLYM